MWQMKRWVRPCLLMTALILGIIVVLSGVGVTLFRSTPAWYAARVIHPAAEQQKLAAVAENKLIVAQNWAAELRAMPCALPALPKPARNTFLARWPIQTSSHSLRTSSTRSFDKWSVLYGWADQYSQFVEDPAIILRDGRLIFAGNMQHLGTVVSVQFRPSVSESGSLRLDLAEVDAGKLAAPRCSLDLAAHTPRKRDRETPSSPEAAGEDRPQRIGQRARRFRP